MEEEAQSSRSNTRSAELPDDFGETDSPPETTESEKSREREDRGAVPPVRRGQTEASTDQQENQAEEDIPEKLVKWEKPIDKYREATLEAAPRVAWITEESLHRERGYDSIGTYADERFGISRQRWYQLAACGEVLDQLRSEQTSTAVDTPLPSNEAQTRPLQSHRGDGDFLWKAWTETVEEFGPSPRRTDVKDVVDELTSENSDTDTDGDSDENSDEEPTDEESEPENPEVPEDKEGPDTSSEEPDESPSDGEPSEPEPSGEFDIDRPEEVDPSRSSESSGDRSSPTKEAIEDLAEKVEQEENDPPDSSAEHKIATIAWPVLVRSLEETAMSLPEPGPAEILLKPNRLNQIADISPGTDEERVLVCPAVDLFADVVPTGVVEVVLAHCRKTKHKPVLYTHRLGRAAGFDLSGLWVGTPAERSSLEKTEQALNDAAPDAAVRWLLYDIAKKDKEDPPSFSGETDWIVYDPPGGAGVSLHVGQTQALVEAAEEAGADWSFRSAFKTCGDSDPDQGEVEDEGEDCVAEDENDDSGPEDGPSGGDGDV